MYMEMSWWKWSSFSSSSSTVLQFFYSPLSLFLVFLLFSSLSFFVVDGVIVGEKDSMMSTEKENTTRTTTMGITFEDSNRVDRMKTIEMHKNNPRSDNNNRKQRNTIVTTTSESVENSSKNSTHLFDWHWNWDPEWEKEMAAGLTTMSIISDGHLTSTFLSHGVIGRFVFVNENEGNWLSFTVTPCTSLLHWSVKFLPVSEQTQDFTLKNSETLKIFRSDRIITWNKTNCEPGFYTLEIRPVLADTYIHFYVTTTHFEDGMTLFSSQMQERSEDTVETGTTVEETSLTYNFISSPAPLVKRQGGNGISLRKLRGRRLSIRWASSPMNPQITHYCIVVNTRKDYPSLCSAQGERSGVVPPDLMHLPYYYYEYYKRLATTSTIGGRSNNSMTNVRVITTVPGENDLHLKLHSSNNKTYEDIILGCLKKKRNYILHDLKDGQLYYINVYIKNIITNLSYPYLRTTLTYKHSQNDGENILRDSKAFKVTLPEKTGNDTSKILKFNLKKPCTELTMYAMICGGGSIKYHIFNGNRSVYQSSEVTSLDIIKIEMPRPGKYSIEISQISGKSEDRSRGTLGKKVEFFVSKKNKRFPLPKLPVIRKIVEDMSQRTCDSVTIEWWPSLSSHDTEYCIYLKKENRKRTFNFKEPNQCDLERNLKNDRYITHSYCLQRTATGDEKLLRQRLSGLQQATIYVLQLIVRRQNGASLSYDLYHVSTADECQ